MPGRSAAPAILEAIQKAQVVYEPIADKFASKNWLIWGTRLFPHWVACQRPTSSTEKTSSSNTPTVATSASIEGNEPPVENTVVATWTDEKEEDGVVKRLMRPKVCSFGNLQSTRFIRRFRSVPAARCARSVRVDSPCWRQLGVAKCEKCKRAKAVCDFGKPVDLANEILAKKSKKSEKKADSKVVGKGDGDETDTESQPLMLRTFNFFWVFCVPLNNTQFRTS